MDRASVWGLIQEIAAEQGVDPYVPAAIVQVESVWDPNAEGDGGCSRGLMQLNMCAGLGIGHTLAEVLDPRTNLSIGIEHLALTPRGGDVGVWAATSQRPLDPVAYAAAIRAAYTALRASLVLAGGGGPRLSQEQQVLLGIGVVGLATIFVLSG